MATALGGVCRGGRVAYRRAADDLELTLVARSARFCSDTETFGFLSSNKASLNQCSGIVAAVNDIPYSSAADALGATNEWHGAVLSTEN